MGWQQENPSVCDFHFWLDAIARPSWGSDRRMSFLESADAPNNRDSRFLEQFGELQSSSIRVPSFSHSATRNVLCSGKAICRSYAAVFRWMPFSGNCWEAHQERILRSNFATGTEWTCVALVCSMPSSRLPFVSFWTNPPNWACVVFLNIIRRDVSVFGGMPLRREQRMRLGERHKRLLPARGCPSLIHGHHATAAARPCQPNSSRPFRAQIFLGH